MGDAWEFEARVEQCTKWWSKKYTEEGWKYQGKITESSAHGRGKSTPG